MNSLPVKVERRWLVDTCGVAIEHKPSPGPLTKHQRHAAYRIAIQKVLTFLDAAGFKCNCIEQSTVSISVERQGCGFDIRLQKPPNVAYVTSYQGYRYEDVKIGEDLIGAAMKKVNAKVVTLGSLMKGDYVIQIVATNVSSGTPLFIELPEDVDDPERYTIRSILAALADLSHTFPRLKQEGDRIMKSLDTDLTALPPADLSKFI